MLKMVNTREKRLWRASGARVTKADKVCDWGHREPLEGYKADSRQDSRPGNDAVDYNLKQERTDPWIVEMEIQEKGFCEVCSHQGSQQLLLQRAR